jgi:hypothetical protein
LIAGTADVDEMVAALGDRASELTRRELTAQQQAALEASLGAAPPAANDH